MSDIYIRFCEKKVRFIVVALCLLIISYLLPLHTNAQEQDIIFERISLEEGLSESIIYAIFKDSKGFMWFGTESGLNRYDGYAFKIYKHKPFDTASLSNNTITSINEDQSGFLWIGTADGGLNRFDRATETFTHYRPVPGDSGSLSADQVYYIHLDKKDNVWVFTGEPGIERLDRATGSFLRYQHISSNTNNISEAQILSIFEDNQERLWIGTTGGLWRYDSDRDVFVHYKNDPDNHNSLSDNRVLSIYESPKEPGVLWIGTGDPIKLKEGGGLNRFDTRTGKWIRFNSIPGDPNSISSDIVGQVLEDRDGILWIGTKRGLNRFDRMTKSFTHFLPDPANPASLSNAIRTIIEDIRGNLWFITVARNGIYHFDKKTNSLTHFVHNPNNPNSISHNTITQLYEDDSGVLWIGTNTGGLNKVDHFAKKFTSYVHDPKNPNSLSNNLVRSIYEDKYGYLWIGVGTGGLNRYSPDRSRITHYVHDPKNHNSVSNNNIWSLFEDKSGTLWVGTYGGGLNKFNREKETFMRYIHDPENPKSISHNTIRVIFEDSAGRLWIGTDGGGLNLMNKENGDFLRFKNNPDDPRTIAANSVRAIVEDKNGTLWIGTFGGGLNKLTIEDSKGIYDFKAVFKRFQHNISNIHSLSNDAIQSLYVDQDNQLWIGTFGGGLNRLDTKTEIFEHYTEDNSKLPNNVVYAVLGDKQGNIWFSSNRGLSKYNLRNNEFKNYDVYDGLQSLEFNGQAGHRSRSGEMFFGGISGLNAFFPDSLIENPYLPKIALTDFRIFNESVKIGTDSPLKKHISETEKINLAYWQNDISFSFVALHFNRSENNRYAYMLENYDEGWRYSENQRTATYTNLDPGEYIFRVRGSNNDGIWNNEGASVRIIISPPWWKSIWAQIVYILVGLSFIALLYRYQHTRVVKKERSKALVREAELRAQAAEAQSRAIQAENERKTHELEKARKIQLSMLPKTIPVVPHMDIAVYMQTATEVGGDYYDFTLDETGRLTIAIGDATGHGLSAGTMVSVIKSLFVSNAAHNDIREFFHCCTKTIKEFHLGNLYMGLTLAKIENHMLHVSAAGMPPIYLFRKERNAVETITLKGMPLGAFDDFLYDDAMVRLENGDTILLLSDGLPELFNEHLEMFDYNRVVEVFRACGNQGPQKIIDTLVKAANDWCNGKPPNDDITFVVLKMRDGISG